MREAPTPKKPAPAEPVPSFVDRVRAKIAALRERGPKPRDLGDGGAAEAGRALAGRRHQIDRIVDEASR